MAGVLCTLCKRNTALVTHCTLLCLVLSSLRAGSGHFGKWCVLVTAGWEVECSLSHTQNVAPDASDGIVMASLYILNRLIIMVPRTLSGNLMLPCSAHRHNADVLGYEPWTNGFEESFYAPEDGAEGGLMMCAMTLAATHIHIP